MGRGAEGSDMMKATKAAASLGFETVTRLLNESGISARVMWESLLLPVLGLRPAGALHLPGELPDAGEVARSAGQLFNERVHLGSGRGAFPARLFLDKILFSAYRVVLPPALYRSKLAGISLDDVLRDASSYRAHLTWAKTLGLHVCQVAARANAREVFFYAARATRRDLNTATALRHRIRGRLLRRLDTTKVRTFMVYPEELFPEYIELMGRILGYPDCCVEAYIRDRQGEVFYPEVRAAAQLEGAGGRPARGGEGPVPDSALPAQEPQPPVAEEHHYAYFVRNFVPCRPDCPEAAALGRRAAAALAEVDPRLGRAYLDGLLRNRDTIRRAPGLIARREKAVAQHLGHVADEEQAEKTAAGAEEGKS